MTFQSYRGTCWHFIFHHNIKKPFNFNLSLSMYSKYLHVSSSTIFGILYYINRISSSQFFCRRRSYSALYIHGGNVDLTEFYNFFFVFFLFWSNANLSLVYLLFFKNESLPKTSCTDSIPHLVCRIVSILVLHYNKMTIVVGVFLYIPAEEQKFYLIYDDDSEIPDVTTSTLQNELTQNCARNDQCVVLAYTPTK